MAFHYPVLLLGEQPYVGGKRHCGGGGSSSDFLMAALATQNLAIVEIKKPDVGLFAKPYRGTLPPSAEMSGAVAQVTAQRHKLQESFHLVGRELIRLGYGAHSVDCLVLIGRMPADEVQAQAFEQYRRSLHGVTVVTFDELSSRLKAIYELLDAEIPPTPRAPRGIGSENAEDLF